MKAVQDKAATERATRDVGVGVFASIGGGLAVAGAALAIVGAARPPATTGWLVGVCLYAACLVYRFAMASVAGFMKSRRLRTVAEAGDFVIVAGTLMPWLLSAGGGAARWVMFAAAWAYALVGYTLRALWVERLGPFSVAIGYFAFLVVLPLVGPLRGLVGVEAANWLLAGGVLYIVGLFFKSNRRFPYADSLWTAFSVAGATIHYFGLSAASS